MSTFFDTYTTLHNKIAKNLNIINRRNKLKNKNNEINIDVLNYNLLLKYDFTLKQLKSIASENKLNISGNKLTLLTRVYIFFHLKSNSIIIQKYVRGYLYRKYIRLHGPGFKNKSVCNNNFDISTMDELTNVPYNQYFSYKDIDNFIYGFDILSFYNLIKTETIINPFNKNKIPKDEILNFCYLIKFSKLLNIEYKLIDDSCIELSLSKKTELRVVALFQKIDELGNYTKPDWFLSLGKIDLIDFIDELMDIWNYRANMPIETKIDICPPTGNPFVYCIDSNYLENLNSITKIRNVILDCLDLLVGKGSVENKNLGALYILSALTLVNDDAATSMPWLYESVRHI
jgi:hypothetical protein